MKNRGGEKDKEREREGEGESSCYKLGNPCDGRLNFINNTLRGASQRQGTAGGSPSLYTRNAAHSYTCCKQFIRLRPGGVTKGQANSQLCGNTGSYFKN